MCDLKNDNVKTILTLISKLDQDYSKFFNMS